MVLIFNLTSDFIADENLTIKNETNIEYNSKNVKLKLEIEVKLKKISGKYTFLYSTPQTINVSANQEIINIEFNMGTYYDEVLFLESDLKMISLDKCIPNGKILKCQISKKKIWFYSLRNK